MQVKKEQWKLDTQQRTGSKLGKEYKKAVYCHPAYLTYMQSTSCEMPGWMKCKMESRLLGEIINNLRYTDDTTLMAESEEIKNLLKVKEESKKKKKTGLKFNIPAWRSICCTRWGVPPETRFRKGRIQWQVCSLKEGLHLTILGTLISDFQPPAQLFCSCDVDMWPGPDLWAVYTAAAAARSLQSSPTLCDPTDGNPPGSPIPGILQARTLEWVAISSSNAWKWKVKVKSLSRVRLLATPWTAAHQAPLSMGFSRQEYWSGVPLPSPMSCVHTRLQISSYRCEEAETKRSSPELLEWEHWVQHTRLPEN